MVDPNEQDYESRIQALSVGAVGGREPMPFEKAPPRVVMVPYRTIATNQGTSVRYDYGDTDLAKYINPSDLRPLEQVRFSKNQGELSAIQRQQYTGDLLVDEKNRIARPQYDVNGEPLGLLRSFGTNAARRELLDLLYQKGFYSSGKPSANGFSGSDQRAVGNLLEYANAMGRTWNVARLEIESLENERGLGGAAALRTSSREDIREYVNRDSLELLGRTLTRAEFREALQMIQARERAPRAGETQASLGALSAEAVREVAPREVQMQGAADAIDVFREMLRSSRG